MVADPKGEGVAPGELIQRAGVRPEARFVVCHGFDNGWTTNLPLTDFLSEDALLADTHDGQLISPEHGDPWKEERFRDEE